MNDLKDYTVLFLVIAVAVIGGITVGSGVALPQFQAWISEKPQELSSVTQGNDYNATGTAPFGGVIVDRLIKAGSGSLGSVIVTKTGDAAFQIYDATSTQAMQTGQFSSSTQLLASFPASPTVGVYVFDVTYNYGLLLEVSAGNIGTSTITYR